MPYAPDKIIINSNGITGTDALIEAEMESAQYLGGEIQSYGWAAETVDMRNRLAKACEEHRLAEMKYYDFMRGLNKEMMEFIDKKLATP